VWEIFVRGCGEKARQVGFVPRTRSHRRAPQGCSLRSVSESPLSASKTLLIRVHRDEMGLERGRTWSGGRECTGGDEGGSKMQNRRAMEGKRWSRSWRWGSMGGEKIVPDIAQWI